MKEAKVRDREEFAPLYDDLTGHYQHRLSKLQLLEGEESIAADEDRHIDLSLETLRVERETAIRLRDEGRINDEVLRSIERELDLDESRIADSDDV